MATVSPRGQNVYFSSKEATAGTPDTTCFFKGSGPFMVKPAQSPTQESDKGKMGAGEYGTIAETQAYWSEFTYTFQRLSEIGYFFCNAMGLTDVVDAGLNGQAHICRVLPVATRALPTFTIEYGPGGASANAVYAHCIINEVSLTATKGGTGIVEGTVSGFCNAHSVSAGVFSVLAAGSMATPTHAITAEPLVNIRSFLSYIGTGVATTLDSGGDFDYTGTDLTATPTTVTTLIDGFTLRYNNGLTVDQLARPGGNGIISDTNRGDPNVEFELMLRKDIASYDPTTPLLADTQLAMEFLFTSKLIGGTEYYALDIVLPEVQITGQSENDETPTALTIPCEVHADSNGDPLIIGIQNNISDEFNDTI